MTQPLIRVLLVEDDEEDFLLTRDIIGQVTGQKIVLTWCESFETGIEALRREPFDVCLVDYRIGGETGIDFMRQAKAEGIDVPMILLTGLGDHDLDVAATEAGAADFLEKGDLTPALIERSMRFARAHATVQRSLAAHASLLQGTLDNVGPAIATLDSAGRLVACNRRFDELIEGVDELVVPGETAVEPAGTPRREGAAFARLLAMLVAATARPPGTIDTRDGRVLLPQLNWTPDLGRVIVVSDITDQRRMESDLRRAKDAAEAVSDAKSSFLAKMSHEFRTPLNAIIGFSELMLSEARGRIAPTEYGGYLQDIHASGRHLLSIVDDILDFAKIEAGKLDMAETDVSVGGEIAFCGRLMEPDAAARRISLALGLPNSELHIRADRTAFRRILLNLLSNAIKFTEPGGRVAVDARMCRGGVLEVSVSDTGIGMNAEDVAMAFEPFRQARAGRHKATTGTGLGLSIVQGLARLHEADVRIDSTPRVGTTVTVAFAAGRVRGQGCHPEQRVSAS